MARLVVFIVLVLILSAGCASSNRSYRFLRMGATETEVSRDTFECAKDVKEMHRSDFVVGPLWYVAATQAKAEKKQQELMNLCMQGRGYTIQEVTE